MIADATSACPTKPWRQLTIVHHQQRALGHEGGGIPHLQGGPSQPHRLAWHLGSLQRMSGSIQWLLNQGRVQHAAHSRCMQRCTGVQPAHAPMRHSPSAPAQLACTVRMRLSPSAGPPSKNSTCDTRSRGQLSRTRARAGSAHLHGTVPAGSAGRDCAARLQQAWPPLIQPLTSVTWPSRREKGNTVAVQSPRRTRRLARSCWR